MKKFFTRKEDHTMMTLRRVMKATEVLVNGNQKKIRMMKTMLPDLLKMTEVTSQVKKFLEFKNKGREELQKVIR